MSKETKVEQNLVEKSNVSKKFNGKKWGIIGVIVVVLIALIAGIGISIYNTPANRLSRQLDLGNIYLEEQQYEEAIVAFEEAIAIDDRCLEAYVGGIGAYRGLGSTEGLTAFYDRALSAVDRMKESELAENMDAVVEIYLAVADVYGDDIEKVIETLKKGYELSKDDRLKARLDEKQFEAVKRAAQQTTGSVDDLTEDKAVGQSDSENKKMEQTEEHFENQLPGGKYLELPFSLSDITIKGYDLLEPHYDEVAAAFGLSKNGEEIVFEQDENKYYGISSREGGSSGLYFIRESDLVGVIDYVYWDYSVGEGEFTYVNYPDDTVILEVKYFSNGFMRSSCNLPVYTGDTYEDFCKNLGVDLLMKTVEGQSEEFHDGNFSDTGMVYGNGNIYVKDDTGLYKVFYCERKNYVDWPEKCLLYLQNCDGGPNWIIEAYFTEGKERCDLLYFRPGPYYPWELAEYVNMD